MRAVRIESRLSARRQADLQVRSPPAAETSWSTSLRRRTSGVLSRLQLSFGVGAMLLHFSAVINGLNIDGIFRSCPTKTHLLYVMRHRTIYYTMVLYSSLQPHWGCNPDTM